MPSNEVRELRRLAEARLREKDCAKSTLLGAADNAERLFHELQVHHIELELQNEELKLAKSEVESGLEKYTSLYDFAPVGYFSLDDQGEIQELNLTGATLLGVERSRLLKRRFQLFVAPDSCATFNAFLEKVFVKHENQSCEISLLKAGQTGLWANLQAQCALTPSEGRNWCRLAISDITSRKQAEEAQKRIDILAATNKELEEEILRRQATEAALLKSEARTKDLLEQSQQLQSKLKRISHQVLMVQENERKMISRELHDEIIQLLLGLNLQLALFTKAAIDPELVRRTIAPTRRMVEKSVKIVHQIAHELHPSSLDDLGLIPALRSYLDAFPKRKGRRISFTASPLVEALDSDTRTVLFRVTQESLTNMAQHSKAKRINIKITPTRQGILLEITDDGVGFDVNELLQAKWKDKLGINGMRERVEMVGGQLEISSSPGSGTTIRAEVPREREQILKPPSERKRARPPTTT
jgi:PAS domain S-box-containing protein